MKPAVCRALVVGVSEYPNPDDRLPAVAGDVREMAKVLSSRRGVFPVKGVTVLADKQATRDRVLKALGTAFGGRGGDTVFAYLAGHGVEVGGRYYYVAHDTDSVATAVPLAEVKAVFDATKFRRAFLWLDFCHSGGILARGGGGRPGDLDAVRRAIGVVSGSGKVIVAACTSGQKSYESAALGHGYFTHALLRGLRGEAVSAGGEVTAHSLYEFIDRQVASPRQQPVFFGETTGRIVLAHYPERAASPGKTPIQRPTGAATKKKAAGPAKKKPGRSGTWVMLGEQYLLADSVRHDADNKLTVTAVAEDGHQAAFLNSLRTGQFGGGTSLPFVVAEDAHVVRVRYVASEVTGGQRVFTLTLQPEAGGFGGGSDMTHSYNGTTYTTEDVARLRAGRILLNDPPVPGPIRGYSAEDHLLRLVAGSGRFPVTECVVRTVFSAHGSDPNWRTYARLRAVFLLRASGVVDHVLTLIIGPVRGGRVAVKFAGRRASRFSGTPPTPVEVSGACPLTGVQTTSEESR